MYTLHYSGLVEKALVGYSYSLRPNPYREVEQHRAAWDDQRKELRSAVAMGNSRLHFLTTASQETVEVENLRLSAWLSGIPLEVILAPYQYSCDKSITFGRYLEENKHRIADDDVVVLMDAYDVLLLPAARSFAAVREACCRGVYLYFAYKPRPPNTTSKTSPRMLLFALFPHRLTSSYHLTSSLSPGSGRLPYPDHLLLREWHTPRLLP